MNNKLKQIKATIAAVRCQGSAGHTEGLAKALDLLVDYIEEREKPKRNLKNVKDRLGT